MIRVRQPLLRTHAQDSSPLEFLGSPALLSSNNLALIRKGRRSGSSLSLEPFPPASPLRFLPSGHASFPLSPFVAVCSDKFPWVYFASVFLHQAGILQGPGFCLRQW